MVKTYLVGRSVAVLLDIKRFIFKYPFYFIRSLVRILILPVVYKLPICPHTLQLAGQKGKMYLYIHQGIFGAILDPFGLGGLSRLLLMDVTSHISRIDIA